MAKAIFIFFQVFLMVNPFVRAGTGGGFFFEAGGSFRAPHFFMGDVPSQDTTAPQGNRTGLRDSVSGNQVTSKDSASLVVLQDSLALPIDTTAISKAPIDINIFYTGPATPGIKPDSVLQTSIPPSFHGPYGPLVMNYIKTHPYFKAGETSLRLRSLERKPEPREWIFYLFTGMLFYLALLRISFRKYFNDLFRVFFNSSLRQKQIREQLIQEPLPSLLLNLFFVVSGGVYLFFLLSRKGLAGAYEKWLLLGACILLLATVYLVKFLVMRALGWIFGRREVVETYLFVVFMVNKMAGMALIPFSILLAYAAAEEASTLIFLSLVVLGILCLYRLVRGFSAIHKTFRINQLQFILFVAAFEVVPILLLYKGLNTLF
jgi:hypothetical protein